MLDNITVIAAPATQISIRNCVPFTQCITKIDGTTIVGVEDLDLVMPMYNLIGYNLNYSETTGSLWFYSKDEITNFNNDVENTDDFKCFKCKAKLLGNTVAQSDPNQAAGILRNFIIGVPLKYLSNFWRSLQMPLINCKIELKIKWTKHCVLAAVGSDNTNDNLNNVVFTIKDTKLYVPVVTLSAKDNHKLSKLLSKGFER